MQKLNTQLLKRGRKPDPILDKYLNLQVGKDDFLSRLEWKHRSTPYLLLWRRCDKTKEHKGKKFSTRLISNRTGWVITRVK